MGKWEYVVLVMREEWDPRTDSLDEAYAIVDVLDERVDVEPLREQLKAEGYSVCVLLLEGE